MRVLFKAIIATSLFLAVVSVGAGIFLSFHLHNAAEEDIESKERIVRLWFGRGSTVDLALKVLIPAALVVFYLALKRFTELTHRQLAFIQNSLQSLQGRNIGALIGNAFKV